ncbi:hypothetical protein UC8_39330 [Roseimaritima ulvae]|uniref:Uncharacterized protein n=1 Tax=Roseimaritima ulvae TaxID=980254 RepID=A0A5B9QWZ4_9BACT|nr:hypothetical protein UC8_39330 [Roseimaritima ulvae]
MHPRPGLVGAESKPCLKTEKRRAHRPLPQIFRDQVWGAYEDEVREILGGEGPAFFHGRAGCAAIAGCANGGVLGGTLG